jgi:hypothetical protein
MSDQFGSIIPKRWSLGALPTVIVQEIIYRWLDVEVLDPKQIQVCEQLRGWRNREVRAYIVETDWTRAMFDKPLLHEYQQPSLAYLRYHAPHRHVPVIPMGRR